ncbi:MAG: hypothetical protein AB1401_05015 [Thermodesulfobacteriota bacterium]
MKKVMAGLTTLILLFSFIGVVLAKDVHVKGYYRKDGTYVQPHYRTAPNKSVWDNYSTKGNINPYTGKEGTVDPYNLNNSFGDRSYKNNSFNNNLYTPQRPYNFYSIDQDSND